MRDENEVQKMADLANDYANRKRVKASGSDIPVQFAGGVAAALDWVLDDESEELTL